MNNPDYTTDVLIAGAGPGGATTSIFLAKEKIKHIIIDKAIFPRDKICGDALSGKTVGMLKRITPHWQRHFLADESKAIICAGIQFIAPGNASLDVPFLLHDDGKKDPPGFVSRRMDFDNTLVELIERQYATLLTGTLLQDIEETDNGLLVTIQQQGEQKHVLTKMIVGAEGRGSIVAKKMAQQKMDPAHYSGGIRGYYTNVSGLHPQHYIELHFLTAFKPGYLWIFPLPNGAANVGVGMLSKDISQKKINLKQLMLDMIANHPALKGRFANATLEGSIEGWGLPLGSKKRPLSGNRFLLTGDAASIIDPFTGEGIGNAMVSGLVASRTIKNAVDANDFSAACLHQYDEALYKKLWTELKLSHYLQLLSGKPRLFDFVVGKAARSKELRETISCMFENVDIRKKFTNPLFYLKILFNR